jgi:Uncharacterized protein conserved in bacteria
LLLGLLLLLAVIGVAVAMAATMSHGHNGTVKAAHNATYASLLVSSSGMTLYHLTSEKPGSIACTGKCATFWPPLVLSVNAKAKAGSGVTASKLGTIKRPDGHTQVTLNGIALYRYSLDKKAGDVKGQGVEGIWYAVTPAGTLAKAGTTPPATATTTTTGGGYGYGG